MTHLPEHLIAGYRSFMKERFAAETYRSLARDGQSPETLVIACCDSRSAPEVIFGAGPGELFVIRNVGNLIPPYTEGAEAPHFGAEAAAIQFALANLPTGWTMQENGTATYTVTLTDPGACTVTVVFW